MSIEIQAASEPSDIIWENRENTPAQRRFREIVTVIISIQDDRMASNETNDDGIEIWQ